MPSPSTFSIPSIGTPLHQLEEDQMILPEALQQQQHNRQSSSSSMGGMGGSVMGGMGGSLPSLGGPSSMMTPHKMPTYAPSAAGFQTPHSMMQPQTPVSTVGRAPKRHQTCVCLFRHERQRGLAAVVTVTVSQKISRVMSVLPY